MAAHDRHNNIGVEWIEESAYISHAMHIELFVYNGLYIVTQDIANKKQIALNWW